MTGTSWEWRDGGSGGPGHMQRVATSAVFTRTQKAYRAYVDHGRGCTACRVDAERCATAEELWSAYQGATS